MWKSDADAFGVTLTAAELQQKVDDWAAIRYENRPHEGLNGRTPFQAFLASPREVRTVDVRALDMLLMPVPGGNGCRTVTKTGIRVDHYDYMPETILPGTEVFVRMDPDDLGRVYAYSRDGREYLGDAVCPQLSGRNPIEVAKQRKAAAREFHEREFGPIRAAMKKIERGGPLVDRMLDVARRDAPSVIAFPKKEEPHTTPELTAALAAADRRPAGSKTTLSDRAAEIHAEMQAPFAVMPGVSRLRTEETPQQRFRRALDARARIEAGETLSADELLWLGGYEAGAEFRGLKSMYDHFDGVISM